MANVYGANAQSLYGRYPPGIAAVLRTPPGLAIRVLHEFPAYEGGPRLVPRSRERVISRHVGPFQRTQARRRDPGPEVFRMDGDPAEPAVLLPKRYQGYQAVGVTADSEGEDNALHLVGPGAFDAETKLLVLQ